MESTNGNEGISKLASVLQSRMHETGKKPQTIDFGKIQGNMSLVTNLFPQPIPKGDYMVCRQLTLEVTGKLKPGDRVLVAWVGDDACVIDIILPGTAV